jgi:hypothetical protein
MVSPSAYSLSNVRMGAVLQSDQRSMNGQTCLTEGKGLRTVAARQRGLPQAVDLSTGALKERYRAGVGGDVVTEIPSVR